MVKCTLEYSFFAFYVMAQYPFIPVGPSISCEESRVLICGTKESIKFDVTGIPFPDILVLKDQKPLEEQKHMKIVASEKNSEMCFDKVILEDEGTYTIRVTNEIGQNETSIMISTQGMLSV